MIAKLFHPAQYKVPHILQVIKPVVIYSSAILNTFAVQKSSELVKEKAFITIKGTCSMQICGEGCRFLFA